MVNVFSNIFLLTSICQARQTLRLSCKNVPVSITMARYIKGYGTIWFHSEDIATILSLSRFKKLYHITYDISKGNYFLIHKDNGGTRLFVESPQVLYWINTQYSDGAGRMTLLNIDDKYSSHVIPYIGTVLINLVEGKRSVYTRRSCLKAKLTRKVQQIIGGPST